MTTEIGTETSSRPESIVFIDIPYSFIPTTSAADARTAYNRIADGAGAITASGSRARVVIPSDLDAQQGTWYQANQVYKSLLASELFPSSDPDPGPSTLTTPPQTPTKRQRIFSYSSPDNSDSRSPSRSRSRLDSPTHEAYSTSPLRNASQRLLTTPQRPVRVVGKTPYKVLDAPELADDFYLNLVDWSSTNILGVGLASCVYLWSAETSRVTKLTDLAADDDMVTSLSWVQQGSVLAVGTRRGFVHLFDCVADTRIRKMSGHTHRVGSLSWSGGLLASGAKDHSIRLRDVRAPEGAFHELHGHKQEVCGLKFSGLQPSLLASGGNDNKLFVWDIRKSHTTSVDAAASSQGPSTALHRFHEHTAAVKAIAWSPHAVGILGSGGGTQDKKLRFWNTGTGAKISELDTGSQVCNLTWSLNSNEVVSTHGFSHTQAQNQICIWRYPTLDQTATFSGHTHRVLYLAMSPDGRTIVTGAGDETLRFWAALPERKDARRETRIDDVGGRIR
ncbi:WD40 repeat-like protein [Clavulina sp. PMI_390]|nr:WD40 repeat-like protein [Clavulina sp. PMI_390]